MKKYREKYKCCDTPMKQTLKGVLSGWRTSCDSCGFNRYGRDFETQEDAELNYSIKLWNYSEKRV